jgi:hypothetical protein
MRRCLNRNLKSSSRKKMWWRYIQDQILTTIFRRTLLFLRKESVCIHTHLRFAQSRISSTNPRHGQLQICIAATCGTSILRPKTMWAGKTQFMRNLMRMMRLLPTLSKSDRQSSRNVIKWTVLTLSWKQVSLECCWNRRPLLLKQSFSSRHAPKQS